MKNFRLIALLFITHIIFSQNTVPTSGAVNFDTSLKVGNQVSTTQDGQIIRLILQPYRHTGGPWNLKSRDSNTDGAFLDFDYGITGTALTLTSNRKVGINSLIPLNTFEVKVPTSTGTSSSDGISIHDGAANRLGINIGVNTAGEYSFLQAVKGGIGQKNIVLNPIGGNVGIGTTNPQNKLQIGEFNNGGISKLSIPGVYNFEEVKLGQYGNGQNGLEMITHSDQTKSFGVRLYSGTDTGVNGLLIQTADPATSAQTLTYTSKMAITLNGNVGIGITNPSNKLDVNGTIHSKEVKVDLLGWSDFVFKKEYQLPTLQEVEKYIAEKGHLENIPSEEEVLKNGINLGEMNSKLLQKIEELTLYSIQQNKKIEEQAKEIETLKALALRIEKIEKELGQK